jgi:sporulation protein YlmC with PRC-barrel domain
VPGRAIQTLEADMHTETVNGKPHRLIPSDRVEGTRVFNADGKKIGTIKRLMIDKITGNVAYAVLSSGGFLGLGEEYRPLPWASIKYNPAIEAYELNTLMTHDELAKAPSFGEDTEFDWGNRQREIDTYWVGF